MNKIKSNIILILRNIPILNNYYKNQELNKHFRNEINLLNNKSLCQSPLSSVIHFSINKSATVYIKHILQKISIENGLLPIDFHNYAFASKAPFLDKLSFAEMENYKQIFKAKGYLYSVFGGMIENIDNLNQYNVILSIRDPRDILVSNYFSAVYSHPLPPDTSNKRENFIKARERVKNIVIDEYVLSESTRVFSIFERYKNLLLDKFNNVRILRYENMINNYEKWLEELCNIIQLSISDTLKQDLILNFKQKRIEKENIYSHNRRGIAGDYKEKLKKETIEEINYTYKELLSYFAY